MTFGAACATRPTPIGVSFAGHVGVVQSARDSSLCLTMANAGLAAGDTLLVVSTGERGEQGVAVVRVDGPREKPCTAPGDEWGSVSIEHASFYTLRVAQGALLGEPAIAVRARAPIAVGGRHASTDLDGDGRPERFAQCTSREGIHLRVVTPAAGREIERWHAYFYVPYDLEPTCPGVRDPGGG